MIGTTLGHYRIARLVGKGGMGEVYAAEDLTLGRTVAIKVLPAGLEAQPAEMERFAREAKSIAALNHRAIVTLYSFEESGGTHFITMELVEGQPLSTTIPASGLPFPEVLRLGMEMADAIAAAHDRGIVHRDLKPANVLLRSDGQVKILDFGLAKLRQPDAAAGELPTQALTGEGRIVGTVAYMSPEQAEGRTIDHRSDIFSLGVVLYELATGQRPFQGDTSLSVLSAVLKDQPKPASQVNPAVPAPFARVLKTCLQKDPDRRYQSAKDLRNELQTLKEELDSGDLARPIVAPPPASKTRTRRWLLPAVGLGIVAAAALFWPAGLVEAPAPLVLQHTRLTSASGVESDPVLSPDGKWFLYVSTASGNADIYLQSVGGQTAMNLTKDSPVADTEPAFSWDGDRIAFRSARDGAGLYIMGRTGDAPRRVVPGGFDPTWSPDGKQLAYSSVSTIVPASRGALGALRVVNIESGEVTELTNVDALNPAWSPNGRFIAFWGMGRTPGGDSYSSQRDIWVIAATGGAPWKLTDDAHVDWTPTWTPDGSFIFFGSNRGGSMNLWRIGVDPETGRARSEPQAVTTPAGYVGFARLSSGGDRVIYESRETTSNIYRASFDAARASIGVVAPITSGSRTFRFVDESPDGQRLVLGTSYLQQEDLFVSRADGAELRQLTTDAFNDRWPEWSPAGDLIAFYSDRSGKYEIWTVTPSGQLAQLTHSADHSVLYPRWSPSGLRMTFSDISVRPAVVIFDPRKPWKDQTPDELPPPAGPRSYLGPRPVWSPDESRLAGSVGGVVTIYDIASRRYSAVPGAIGNVVAWLKEGRLLVIRPDGLRLVEPATGESRDIPPPPLANGLAPTEIRVSRDERSVFITLAVDEADLWLVTLGAK